VRHASRLLQAWAFVCLGLAVRALGSGLLADRRESVSVVPITIDLNRGSLNELQVLPGIGPVRAEAIVLERIRSGGFDRVEDLVRVAGIGPLTIERLRPVVSIAK
jgi:competence protein ComEA